MLLLLAPSTCFTCFLSALLDTFAKSFVLLVFLSTVNMVTAVKETSNLFFCFDLCCKSFKWYNV